MPAFNISYTATSIDTGSIVDSNVDVRADTWGQAQDQIMGLPYLTDVKIISIEEYPKKASINADERRIQGYLNGCLTSRESALERYRQDPARALKYGGGLVDIAKGDLADRIARTLIHNCHCDDAPELTWKDVLQWEYETSMGMLIGNGLYSHASGTPMSYALEQADLEARRQFVLFVREYGLEERS
jgi:hypothetical protein